jgi:hypothetical protein
MARRVYYDNYNVPVHEIAVNIQVSFPDWYLPNYIVQNIVET